MKDSDLKISCRDGVYHVKVIGRANFEYAVPLRELANSQAITNMRIEMSRCEAMDSTFMGVLTMLGLGAKKRNGRIELINASEFLQKLLRDLGVKMLFEFVSGEVDSGDFDGDDSGFCAAGNMLATAETVAAAHRTLTDAYEPNSAKFDGVISMAEADVERLRKEKL